MNKSFHGFDDDINDNEFGGTVVSAIMPKYNIDNAFTPAFVDYFCRYFGISHYVFNINQKCFMKYVHKNQNQRALCYYAMNNHMYLVKNPKLVKSLVEKAKNIEHKINTGMFESDDMTNHFLGKKIYLNKPIRNIKINFKNRMNNIFIYSRDIKNINDIFDAFIIEFNLCPIITKCHKTNIMELDILIMMET